MSLAEDFASRVDYHQLPSYARVMEHIGWDIVPLSSSYLFVRRVGPIAFAKFQHPEVINGKALISLQRKLHIVEIFIEPSLIFGTIAQKNLEEAGFKKTGNHHAYTKTLICNIRGSESEVLSSFSKTTSYQMRHSQKMGVQYLVVPFGTLTQEQKREIFALHAGWSKEKKVAGYADSFLEAMWQEMQQEGRMILAYHKKKLEGALFLLTHHRVGMYFYQFSSRQARHALYIPSGMAFVAIQEAKRLGCDIFDLCSAYDERYPEENVAWKGFSTHKEHFHPTPIYYPPAFVKTNIPFL